MGKAWDRIKTIILNIFTEEVEVEVKVPVKEPEPKKKEQTAPVAGNRKSSKLMEGKSIQAMPRKESFRFPVIPDKSLDPPLDRTEQLQERQTRQTKRKASQQQENREKTSGNDGKLETAAELALKERLAEQEQRRLARRKVRLNKKQHMGTYEKHYAAFEQEKSLRQMDSIPAFVRRGTKEPLHVEESEGASTEPAEELKEASVQTIPVYSKPDELDHVFWKKDATRLEREVVEDIEVQTKEPIEADKGETVSRPSPLELDPKPHLVEAIEETSGEQEVEQPYVKEEKIPAERDIPFEESQPIPSQHDVPHHLLDDPEKEVIDDQAWLEEKQFLLERTLTHFKIKAKVVHVTQGPTVTRFEIQPELGVKVSTIRNLADDLKLNLAAKEIRIEAPIPGKHTVGIEIPNAYPQTVTLQQIIETDVFTHATSPLSIALGVTIEGDPLITNIEKMPHGLIAGATGSGKSVCINTILLSLLYKSSYDEVKFLLIDPKMVELAPYNDIPHLLSPVITDVKAATAALKWAVAEMEERYERFVEAGVRNIAKYNEKVAAGSYQGEKMPYIVIVIDELADLMMVSPQDVEDAICRIAQKARACGMHLLLATQRPSVDVITGLIKANIPTRIAFTVSSQVDSRTIIDSNGAEKLLGRGDMLFLENGTGRSMRLQGPFVTDEEIERVTAYMRQLAEPNYLFEQEQLLVRMEEAEQDELFEEVLLFVLEQNQASTSLLQRQFRIGYNRAARLIDTLNHQGVISAQNGAKPREVLISYEQAEELFFTK